MAEVLGAVVRLEPELGGPARRRAAADPHAAAGLSGQGPRPSRRRHLHGALCPGQGREPRRARRGGGRRAAAPAAAVAPRRHARGRGLVAATVAGTGVWYTTRAAAPVAPRLSRLADHAVGRRRADRTGTDGTWRSRRTALTSIYVGNRGTELFVRALDALEPVSVFTGFAARAVRLARRPMGRLRGCRHVEESGGDRRAGSHDHAHGRRHGPRRHMGAGRHDHLRHHATGQPACSGSQPRGRADDGPDAARLRREKPITLAGMAAGRPGRAVHHHRGNRWPRGRADGRSGSGDRDVEGPHPGRQPRPLPAERTSRLRHGRHAAGRAVRPGSARNARHAGGRRSAT